MATKTTKKKSAKKSSSKKPAAKKKAASENGKVERVKAKELGISLPQLRVLKHIRTKQGGCTYRQIEAATGYYSVLTALCREGHENSLYEKGLVKEEEHPIDGRDTLTFRITKKGKALLSKK